MNLRKKQDLVLIIIIVVIVLGFSISNYISKQRVYVLSNEEIKDKIEENDYSRKNNMDTDITIYEEMNKDKIVIHIEGQVINPGVYELDADTRVFDAIEAAGGLLESADRRKINLAKKIIDEEYIYIPSQNDDSIDIQNIANVPIGSSKNGELVNINKANSAELTRLPGIGDALANRIIDYRMEKGDFKSIEDLRNVSGIGTKRFDEIKGKITVR